MPTKTTSQKTKQSRTGSNPGIGSVLSKRAKVLTSLVVGFVLLLAGTYLMVSYAANAQTRFVGIAGKCVDNNAQRKVAGNKIQLWTCNTTSAQRWIINTNGTISNINGYCLDVSSVDPGALALLNPCSGGELQQWKVDAAKSALINTRTGLCLEDKNASAVDGNPLWLAKCNGTAAQRWTATKIGAINTANPSGINAPVGDLKGWKQVFVDDFANQTVNVGGFGGCTTNGMVCSKLPASVRAKWWAYPDGWKDTTGNGQYWPSKTMSIKGGLMNIHVHTSGGIHRVAAPVPRIKGPNGVTKGMKYGRYSVRFKADSLKGYKTAWLLWPDTTVQKGGEIDFPEGNLNSTISAFMHPPVRDDQDAFNTSAKYTSWHTATTEWRPDSVTFILDGKVIGKSTSAKKRIPAEPMSWILQTETQTYPTKQPPANSVAGNVQIDWVAAWSYRP